MKHVDSNDPSEPLQSAYKSLRNTETAQLATKTQAILME